MCVTIRNLNRDQVLTTLSQTWCPVLGFKWSYHSLCTIRHKKLLLSKHDTLNQCWFDIGPSSATLAQHQTSIVSMCRVCWVRWEGCPNPVLRITNLYDNVSRTVSHRTQSQNVQPDTDIPVLLIFPLRLKTFQRKGEVGNWKLPF